MPYDPVEGDIIEITVRGKVTRPDANSDYWGLETVKEFGNTLALSGTVLRNTNAFKVTVLGHAETDAEKIARLEALVAQHTGP